MRLPVSSARAWSPSRNCPGICRKAAHLIHEANRFTWSYGIKLIGGDSYLPYAYGFSCARAIEGLCGAASWTQPLEVIAAPDPGRRCHSAANFRLVGASFLRDAPDNLAGFIHELDGRGAKRRDR